MAEDWSSLGSLDDYEQWASEDLTVSDDSGGWETGNGSNYPLDWGGSSSYPAWNGSSSPGPWNGSSNPSVTIVTDYMLYASPAQVAVQVVVVIVMMAATLFGNSVMCYTVYRMPNLRTVTNIFTMNLGVTDLGVGLFVLPVWIVSMTMGATSTEAPFPHVLCQVTAFVTVTLLLVSIATLAGISLDRYFSICYPLRYPMEVTSKRVFITLAYMWLQSIVLASTPFFGWGEYKFRPQALAICNPVWVGNIGNAAFMLTVGVGIPFAVMLFSYTRIIQAARKQAKRIEQIQLQLVNPWVNTGPEPDTPDLCLGTETSSLSGNSNHDLRRFSIIQRWRDKTRRSRRKQQTAGNAVFSNVSKNLKTLKTVFIVVGAFFLCWGPYVILNYWGVQNAHRAIPYIADLLTTLLAFSNSAVNPLIFMFLTRDFRFAVRFIFSRCAECSRCRGLLHRCMGRRRSSRSSSGMDMIRVQSKASNDSGVDLDSVKTSPQHRLLLNKLAGTYDNVAYKRNSMELPVQSVLEKPGELSENSTPRRSPLARPSPPPLPPLSRNTSAVSFKPECVVEEEEEEEEEMDEVDGFEEGAEYRRDSGMGVRWGRKAEGGQRVIVRVTPFHETVVLEPVSSPATVHHFMMMKPSEKDVQVIRGHKQCKISLESGNPGHQV